MQDIMNRHDSLERMEKTLERFGLPFHTNRVEHLYYLSKRQEILAEVENIEGLPWQSKKG